MRTEKKTKQQLINETEKLRRRISELEKSKSQSQLEKNKWKESEERFRSLSEASFEGIVLHDKGKILDANKTFAEMFGYELKETIGMNVLELAAPKWKDTIKENVLSGREEPYEAEGLRKDGSIFPGELLGKQIKYKDREVRITAVRDLTRQKKAEQALKESEEKYSLVVENSNDAIIIHRDGIIQFANSTSSRYIGMPPHELIGKPMTDFVHPDDKKKVWDNFQKRKAGKEVENIYEISLVREDGSSFPAEINVSLIQYQGEPAGLVFIRDITKRKKAEEKIKKSLEEKEVLLKEIHHRVKNNMQVISSLINIQAMRIKDKKAQEIFKDTRNRVMSMALVHERLYRSENLAGIDFKMYIERMSVHLMSYYKELSQNIELKTDVEGILLDITKAVPLGLIANELITNSLKHAFPKSKKGEINIEFYKKGKTYHLNIGDNGIGFPKALDFSKAESMGMDLVNSLVKQINGSIRLSMDKGTLFKITFKE